MVVVDSDPDSEIFISLLEGTQVGDDRVESATTVSRRSFLVVLLAHPVESDLVIDDVPR